MSVSKQRDDKKAYKHAARPPAHCIVSETRPHDSPYSQFHRRCAAKSLHYHSVRSGEVHKPYDDLYLPTCPGGRALHTASIAVAGVVQQHVP